MDVPNRFSAYIMKKALWFYTSTLLFATPFLASAHEEIITNESTWNAFLHIITGLDHVITIGVVLAAIVLSQVIKQRSLRAVSAVTAAAGALLLAL